MLVTPHGLDQIKLRISQAMKELSQSCWHPHSQLQHEGVYQELLEYMKTHCVRDSGVSLVNVVMMRAIGEVKMPSGNGGQATESLQGFMEADSRIAC